MADAMGAKKKWYVVHGVVQASVFTLVKASSKREATKIATERGIDSLCHRCDGGTDITDRQEVWVWDSPSDAGEARVCDGAETAAP